MFHFRSFSRNEHFRIFNCLKSQKTIFITLQSNVQSIKPQTKNDSIALNLVVNFLNKILSASYGLLFQMCYRFSDEIGKCLKMKLSPNVEKIGYQMLSACLAINRLVSLLCFPQLPDLDNKKNRNEDCLPRAKSPISSSSLVSILNQKEENESNIVLCRICGKKVSIDKIDQHSNMCKLAYFSTRSMMTTSEKMKKLQLRMQQTLLGISWPENEKYALDFIIPILHIIAVLDKAINLDVDSNDTFGELNFILKDAISNVELKNKNDKLFEFYNDAHTLILEKIKESFKLSKVMNFVQQTTTEKPGITETTIADFEFLKRISSGAYAQVFLAKRSVTNDLCAIKVISKSEIQRKDDRQRIFVEKNILQQIVTPYMTQFCMFFLICHLPLKR